MLGKTVAGFDRDDGNREKCQKHGVTSAEIESVFAGTLGGRAGCGAFDCRNAVSCYRAGEQRSGRVPALTWRDRDGASLIRVISAPYMHAREIEHYERG